MDNVNFWLIGLLGWVGVGTSGAGEVEVRCEVQWLSEDVIRAAACGGVEEVWVKEA